MTMLYSPALINSEKKANLENTNLSSNNKECPLVRIRWCNAGEKDWHSRQRSTHETSGNTPEYRSFFPQDFAVGIIEAQAREIKNCAKCFDYFTNEFEMPKVWWSSYCKRSNGYAGFEETDDDEGIIVGLSTVSNLPLKKPPADIDLDTWTYFETKHVEKDQQSYRWNKLNFFVRWTSEKKQTVIIMFDISDETAINVRKHLLDSMTAQKLKDPLWMYDAVTEEVVRLQNLAVSTMRDLVRDFEKQRAPKENPKPDFEHLHEISRHVTHVSESLDVAVKSVRMILARHEGLLRNGQAGRAAKNVHDRLLFLEQLISSLGLRSESNKERLKNEIQLAFNTVAQYDSRTAVQIGHAAKTDSAAMKTIAFVTLTFLPATFVSAIFSMSFFNFDAGTGTWAVSHEFWIYWAVAVPLTALTFLFWNLWWRQFPPAIIEWPSNEDSTCESKHSILDKLLDFSKKGDHGPEV